MKTARKLLNLLLMIGAIGLFAASYRPVGAQRVPGATYTPIVITATAVSTLMVVTATPAEVVIPTDNPIISTLVASNANSIANLVTDAQKPVDNTLTIIGLVFGFVGPIIALLIAGRTNAKIATLTSDLAHLQSDFDKQGIEIASLKTKNQTLEDQRFEVLKTSNATMNAAIAAGVKEQLDPLNKEVAELRKQLDGSINEAKVQEAKKE